MREEIIKNKVLNIVGQPHVGKSFLALFLAQDIFLLKNLNEILLIPIIDDLTSIPKITNCIIIFDDLYGDLNYDSIGKQTKIVNTLSKNNYVIITSRDYIFEEASINKELITGNRFVINQEGAYNDSQLMRILLNHIKINFPLTSENIIAHKFIIHNKLQIIRKLRFPHNIQLFTTIIDHNVVTKKLLDEKIGKAKVIENLIITWMGQQQIMNSNILLVLAIGKIQDKELLYNICKTNWNYSINNIEECLIENSRLLYQDLSIIRFKHPSFKNAIVSFF
ncbi:MAG: hypothetical protein M0D53_02090 [Flavobacterium sp. JAD_PAG50586_2]|nr:MAG: hypothetical protein M0D53_02090 [Flavobacterium sp. JAD_PAG50586_2]